MRVLEMSSRPRPRRNPRPDPTSDLRRARTRLFIGCGEGDGLSATLQSSFSELSRVDTFTDLSDLASELEVARHAERWPAAIVLSDSLPGSSWIAPWPFLRQLSEDLHTEVVYLASEVGFCLYRHGRLEVVESATPVTRRRMTVAFVGAALSRHILSAPATPTRELSAELPLAA